MKQSTYFIQKTKLVCLALFALLSVSACTSITNLKNDVSESIFGRELANPPEPLADIKQTASSKIIWQTKLGEAGDFDFTPVVEAGYAYVQVRTVNWLS